MKRYLKIYWTFLKLNFSVLLTYRAHFYTSLFTSSLWALFHVATVLLLTARTSSVFGWSRDELLVLTGTVGIFWGFFHIIFARNFDRFAYIVDYGQLDGLLLRPIDSQFYVSLRYINYPAFIRIVVGIIILIWVNSYHRLLFSAGQFINFLLFFLVGYIMIYSLWYIITTIIIWQTRLTNINEFLYIISGFMRYPPEVVTSLRNPFAYLLVPFTVVVATPTKFLLQKKVFGSETLLLLILAVGFFALSRILWKFALRFYTSAS